MSSKVVKPSCASNQIKNFIQLLIQRVHNALFSCHLNNDKIDRANTAENFKSDFNVEIESQCDSLYAEKPQVRNWRYHLTSDHL